MIFSSDKVVSGDLDEHNDNLQIYFQTKLHCRRRLFFSIFKSLDLIQVRGNKGQKEMKGNTWGNVPVFPGDSARGMKC